MLIHLALQGVTATSDTLQGKRRPIEIADTQVSLPQTGAISFEFFGMWSAARDE